MRRYIDVVTEAVTGVYVDNGPLWHGTDLISLALILDANYMTPSLDTENPQGASLTTKPHIAWSFAYRSSNIEQDHIFDWNGDVAHSMPCRGGVLEFDAEKLRQHYKLVHYEDGPDMKDEFGVRVLGDKITNVTSYLSGIIFDPSDLPWFIAYMSGEYGQPRDTYSDPARVVRALQDLTKHPLGRRP